MARVARRGFVCLVYGIAPHSTPTSAHSPRNDHVESDYTKIIQRCDRNTAKPLLEKGAKLESKDNYNDQTALSYAVEKGREAMVKLLLKKGAKVESKDKYG